MWIFRNEVFNFITLVILKAFVVLYIASLNIPLLLVIQKLPTYKIKNWLSDAIISQELSRLVTNVWPGSDDSLAYFSAEDDFLSTASEYE